MVEHRCTDFHGVDNECRARRKEQVACRLEGARMQGNTLWLPDAPRCLPRRLMVHASGPILDRLQLSWLSVAESGRCSVTGGTAAPGGVGTIAQLAPLPSGGADGDVMGEDVAPLAFARAGYQALLFGVEWDADPRLAAADSCVPYYVRPLQKLQVGRRRDHAWLCV
jgi:hypothetical protein